MQLHHTSGAIAEHNIPVARVRSTEKQDSLVPAQPARLALQRQIWKHFHPHLLGLADPPENI